MLDSEPLHDLKGHISNLFKKLPSLLKDDIKMSCEEIIKTTTSDKIRGADYRVTLIQVYLYLSERNVSPKIIQLLKTAVCISKMLYLPESCRHPRHILQLYNTTLLHHDLCRDLFVQFNA